MVLVPTEKGSKKFTSKSGQNLPAWNGKKLNRKFLQGDANLCFGCHIFFFTWSSAAPPSLASPAAAAESDGALVQMCRWLTESTPKRSLQSAPNTEHRTRAPPNRRPCSSATESENLSQVSGTELEFFENHFPSSGFSMKHLSRQKCSYKFF